MKRQFMLLSVAVFAAACQQVDLPEEVTFLKGGTGVSGAGVHVNPSSGHVTSENGGAGGTATFAVSLITKPSANVTVTLTSSKTAEGQLKRTSGACDETGGVAVGSCTLTFTDTTWLNPKSVSVVGQNDDYADGNIAYTINLVAASADSDYNGKAATANLTNNDNDTAGFTATPSSGLVTKDDGSTATAKIKLSSRPTATVTFTVMSDNASAGDVTTPATKSFSFTDGNWSTEQDLVVTGAGTLASYKIVLQGSVTSSDASYSGITGTVLHTGIGVQNVTAGSKIIFNTSSQFAGDLTGISGADAKCNADTNKPNSSTYKAMLVGSTRRACSTADCSGGASEHLDWVLYPNTTYIQSPSLDTIGTTKVAAGIFTFPLTKAFGTDLSFAWTGLSTSWQNSSTCSSWTSIATTGAYGSISSTTNSAIYASNGSCGSGMRIYCAEQ